MCLIDRLSRWVETIGNDQVVLTGDSQWKSIVQKYDHYDGEEEEHQIESTVYGNATAENELKFYGICGTE